MERLQNFSWLVVACTLGSLCLLVGACTVYSIAYPVYWIEPIPALNATHQELAMTEFHGAANVTYSELCEFLLKDTTETADYRLPSYSCGDFAVRLHDEAERHGIRCGIVVVTLDTTGYTRMAVLDDTGSDVPGSDKGHAFNVFNTTDRGLVYIDATGISRAEKNRGRQPHKMIVYFEEGMPLGEISLGQAESLAYEDYVRREALYSRYLEDVRSYRDEVEQFNIDVLKSPNTGTLEIKRQELADKRLALARRDEAKWIMTQPYGTVERAAAYW